jgi:site-specific recombinase XerD
VANNYDPKLVQELLRHSNIKTTLDIYAQAITSAKLEVNRPSHHGQSVPATEVCNAVCLQLKVPVT